MGYDTKVQSIYEKTFKEKRLPPAHVRKLKEAMLAAAKKNKGDRKAIRTAGRAFIKELGSAKKKSATTPAKKGSKKKQTTKPTRTAKKSKAVVVAGPPAELTPAEKTVYESRAYTNDGKIDLRRLTRKTLVGIAKQFGIKTLKKHSDDEVREKIASKLTTAPKDLDALWKSIEPTKLTDCIGVFIDLTNVTCISCPAQSDCLAKFKQHVSGHFAAVKEKAPRTPETTKTKKEEPPTTPDKKKSKKQKKGSKKKSSKPTRKYKSAQAITVFEVPLPAKTNDYYKLCRRILKTIPETIGELRKLVLKHFAPESDTQQARNDLVDAVIDELIGIELIELAN